MYNGSFVFEEAGIDVRVIVAVSVAFLVGGRVAAGFAESDIGSLGDRLRCRRFIVARSSIVSLSIAVGTGCRLSTLRILFTHISPPKIMIISD